MYFAWLCVSLVVCLCDCALVWFNCGVFVCLRAWLLDCLFACSCVCMLLFCCGVDVLCVLLLWLLCCVLSVAAVVLLGVFVCVSLFLCLFDCRFV